MNTVNIAGGQGQLIHEITREWQAREVRGVCVRDGGEITEEDRDVGRSL